MIKPRTLGYVWVICESDSQAYDSNMNKIWLSRQDFQLPGYCLAGVIPNQVANNIVQLHLKVFIITDPIKPNINYDMIIFASCSIYKL